MQTSIKKIQTSTLARLDSADANENLKKTVSKNTGFFDLEIGFWTRYLFDALYIDDDIIYTVYDSNKNDRV